MKTKNVIGYMGLAFVWLHMYSCSTDDTIATYTGVDDIPVVEAEDISVLSTRANHLTMTSFSLLVYNTKTGKFIANKVLHTKNDNGTYTSSKTWRMVNFEMKAMAVSPSMDNLTNIALDDENQYFEYAVSPDEGKGDMVKIGGNMSFTKASTNNKLSMKFVNALSLVTLRARNELKVERTEGETTTEFNVNIYVKGITIHNLQSKGRFNYTSDYNGKWTAIDDEYADYTQDLKEAVLLSSSTFSDVLDSALVLLPQSPEKRSWAPAAQDDASEEYALENGIAKANEDHKVYIELRCSMTADLGNGLVYLWGSEDTYAPVYFPYVKKYCPKAWNTINKQGVYNLKFIKGEALDADGRPIKPQEQSHGESFENAVFINVAPTNDNDEDNVDDWEDWETEGNTIDVEF